MSFLDAISDPQNIKNSHLESRYSGSRKTRSENVGFANVLGVSKVLFKRFPLHFHWISMLFSNPTSGSRKCEMVPRNTHCFASRKTYSKTACIPNENGAE